MFYPSERLCVDEIFRIWYGLGGECINLSLPHYVQMDRKPYAGCKIQDICYERSMVVLNLKLVKGKAADEASTTENLNAPAEDDNYGTTVLK